MKFVICIFVFNKFLVFFLFMCYYFFLFLKKKMRNKMFYFISFFCVYILCIRVLKFDGIELLIIVKDRLYCFSFYIIIIRGYDIISYICFGVYYCVLFV